MFELFEINAKKLKFDCKKVLTAPGIEPGIYRMAGGDANH